MYTSDLLLYCHDRHNPNTPMPRRYSYIDLLGIECRNIVNRMN